MNDDTSALHLQPINAIEAISRAEIDIQIATAKRYPRQLAKVKANMVEMATLDEETAAGCFYNLPRAGKNITGPSVRLAEIAFACYQNLSSVTRVIETVTDGKMPYVTVQSICKDLENNNTVGWEKRRRITGKKSKGGQIDEDDIQLASNAGGAITFRDSVFKIVPAFLWKPVYEAARKFAIGDARTLADRRIRALDAFAKMGVPADRVLAVLERSKVEEITLEDLEVLIGTFTAIKEGSTTIENAFPLVTEKERAAKPDWDKLKKEAAQAPHEPTPPPADPLPSKSSRGGRQRSEPVPSPAVQGPAGATPTEAILYNESTEKESGEQMELGGTEPPSTEQMPPD